MFYLQSRQWNTHMWFLILSPTMLSKKAKCSWCYNNEDEDLHQPTHVVTFCCRARATLQWAHIALWECCDLGLILMLYRIIHLKLEEFWTLFHGLCMEILSVYTFFHHGKSLVIIRLLKKKKKKKCTESQISLSWSIWPNSSFYRQ